MDVVVSGMLAQIQPKDQLLFAKIRDVAYFESATRAGRGAYRRPVHADRFLVTEVSLPVIANLRRSTGVESTTLVTGFP
jgi:hypothetical protein